MRDARIPEAVVVAMCSPIPWPDSNEPGKTRERVATSAEWAVLVSLYLHAGPDGSCCPSMSTLEEPTKRKRRTVARAIVGLVMTGIITRDKAPGKTNAYRLRTRDTAVPSGRDTAVPSTRDKRRHQGDDTLDLKEQEQDQDQAQQHVHASARTGADFEEWWGEYGRIGDKARAFDLYRWWRTTGKASADDLLAAAHAYRAHCTSTDCMMKHAVTFLAKPAKGKSPVWPEWASGEDHGAMDVGAGSHLNGAAGVVKRPLCPLCNTDLTYDEDGEHCPRCEWRAAKKREGVLT